MPNDHRDNPVVLSRIYTRTGDDGTTGLSDGSRARKTDSRLAAYADTDEANCAIGAAIALGGLPPEMVTLLARVQNELFDVGADLANPVSDKPRAYPPIRVDESYIGGLEQACDEYNADLPTLRSFILPGGTPGAALLHTARTVTRRAERSAWAARPVKTTATASARSRRSTSTACLTCCSSSPARPTRAMATSCGDRAATGKARA